MIFRLPFQYNCVGCPEKKLDELQHIVDHEKQITYATFCKHVDPEWMRRFSEQLGLPIHKDWHVTFSKSKTPEGKPVYFFTHSAIEYIFYEEAVPNMAEINVYAGGKLVGRIDSMPTNIQMDRANDEKIGDDFRVPEAASLVPQVKNELEHLKQENARLRKLLGEAQYIMKCHELNCPMNIPNNFSGMHEHLSMYRDVAKQLEEFKCEIDWDVHHAEWMVRLKQGRE